MRTRNTSGTYPSMSKDLKEMIIVGKNSPLVDKFIIKKTSEFYKIIR